MRRNSLKLSSVVACICILVYAAAIVFTGVKISGALADRRVVAERDFLNIAAVISESGAEGFMNEARRSRVQTALNESSALQAVVVSGIDYYIFEREPGATITWINNTPRFILRLGLSRQPLSRPVSVTDQRNVTISAVYTILDYQIFITILKQSLVAILGAFCVAFITLLVQFLARKPELDTLFDDEYADIDNIEDASFFSDLDTEEDFLQPDEPFDEEAPFFTIPEEESSELREPDVPSKEDTEKVEPDDDQVLPELDEEEDSVLPEPDMPLPETQQEDAVLPEQYDVPDTSRHSTLEEEAGVVDKLDSELQSCADSDQELACIMVEYKEVGGTDSLYQQICDEATAFFTAPGCIFEKGERGMTVILAGISLADARKKADTFHQSVLDDHADIFWEASDLCIGISARQGRDVDSHRLLLEASSALTKSMADPTNSVVAFKVDPEKYKTFVNQKK
jgi:hypothetical protein